MPEPARISPTFCAIAAATFTIGALIPGGWGAAGGALGDRTVDALGTWWFQWWIADAFTEGRSFLWTDRLFFPWGKDLLLHTGANIVDPLLILPVRALFGPIAAWNALFFGVLFSNGFTAAMWGRHLAASRPAVLAATALAVLHPFVLSELAAGRPTQAILAPLIVALATGYEAMHGTTSRPGRTALISGIALAVTAWIYWYAACFGALALIALAVARPCRRGALALARAGGVALLLTLPGVIALAMALHSDAIPGLLPVTEWMAGTFAMTGTDGDWIRLSIAHLDGRIGFQTIDGWKAKGIGLGLASGIAVLGVGRRHWPWFAVVGLAGLIAVGPFVAERANPFYHLLLDSVPGMTRLYWPSRALALTVPCGVAGLLLWRPALSHRALTLAATLFVGILVFESTSKGPLPFDRWRPDVPASYACLAGSDGAMIVLPYGRDHEPLLHQTIHHRPLLGGMNARSVSLVPEEQRALRETNTWLKALLIAARNPQPTPNWTQEDKAALGEIGYRWVLLRKASAQVGPQRRRAKRWLGTIRDRLTELAGEVTYESEEYLLYAPWGGDFECSAS